MPATGSDDRLTIAIRELADIQTALADVPTEDYQRRQSLREREEAIRRELRDYRDSWTDHLSIDQLRRRIADVERRLGEHYGNRLSHTAGGQSGFGGGLDPTILHSMHRAMDRSGDLESMKAELTRLKDHLAKLEGN